ncbi:chymotrypsin inhibitor-like [Andrena cerasifolii]|uniref:chymotrypsin inhibitor-like n=1 Tax=Andrena cerasifolii TaxID=2819439 RepID=UPI004037AFBF
MSRYIVALVLFVALVAPALSIRKICVSWKDAVDSCAENETMTLCGRNCEPTCKSMPAALVPVIERCPESVQCSRATTACSCEAGFVRNDQDKCVAPADC